MASDGRLLFCRNHLRQGYGGQEGRKDRKGRVEEVSVFVSSVFVAGQRMARTYRTVISSSQRVVGQRESFCRFMCHDLAPMP